MEVIWTPLESPLEFSEVQRSASNPGCAGAEPGFDVGPLSAARGPSQLSNRSRTPVTTGGFCARLLA